MSSSLGYVQYAYGLVIAFRCSTWLRIAPLSKCARL